MLTRDDLCSYAIQYDGKWDLITKAISKKEKPIVQATKNFICIYDDIYPDSLRNLRYPPWVLFYKGNIELLRKKAVGIVGSRNFSAYGEHCTKKIVSILSKKYVIVSGLAKGIDGIAHEEAIRLGNRTIGIIGSGFSVEYPYCNKHLYKEMKKNQLIISEYPEHVGVRKEHFPWRNRLIAALSDALFVTEASVRSGTMLTVNEAITLNKDIYCVPYPIEESTISGCNLLISQGAIPLYDYKQLLYL